MSRAQRINSSGQNAGIDRFRYRLGQSVSMDGGNFESKESDEEARDKLEDLKNAMLKLVND